MWSAVQGVVPSFVCDPISESRLLIPVLANTFIPIAPIVPQEESLVPLLPKDEIIAQVSPMRYPKKSFHDYSENGSEAMFLLRPSFAAKENVPTLLRQLAFDDDSEPETYFVYEGRDYSRLYLNFNRTGSIKNIVIPADMEQDSAELLLVYSLLGRHMKKISRHDDQDSGKMLTRTFPKEFIRNRAALTDFENRVQRFLNRPLTNEEACIVSRHINPAFRYRTPGQALYLIMLTHWTLTKKSKSTKLFIFALCSMLYGDDVISLVHFSNLCGWFTRNTCDSCFERGLFQDFEVSYQYSTVNFEYSEREVTLAKDADLAYRVLEHEDPAIEDMPPTFHVHEHSFVTMRSKLSTLKFFVGAGQSRVEVDTNVHRGTAIIMAIDGIVRVARARLHGEEFHLFDEWVVRHKLNQRQFRRLKMLISDLVMCGAYHPQLLPLAKTLTFCVLFGVVPDRLFSEYKKGDDLHTLMLSRISRGRSQFVDLMVRPCFSVGMDVDALQGILDGIDFSRYYPSVPCDD